MAGMFVEMYDRLVDLFRKSFNVDGRECLLHVFDSTNAMPAATRVAMFSDNQVFVVCSASIRLLRFGKCATWWMKLAELEMSP